MKYVGRDIDIDPYDQHYWAMRFFEHLKKANMLARGRELSVHKLVRQLEKFCAVNKLDRQHMMHFMLNKRYIEPSAENTYDLRWDKVK